MTGVQDSLATCGTAVLARPECQWDLHYVRCGQASQPLPACYALLNTVVRDGLARTDQHGRTLRNANPTIVII